MNSPQSSMTNGRWAALLFVDDDTNVLKALRRLFLHENYTLYLAEGLTVMQEHIVDLIICDMRMPAMSGAEFLAQALEQWPETVRISLTGYADLQSTIEAVNKGRIYSHCVQPTQTSLSRFSKAVSRPKPDFGTGGLQSQRWWPQPNGQLRATL